MQAAGDFYFHHHSMRWNAAGNYEVGHVQGRLMPLIRSIIVVEAAGIDQTSVSGSALQETRHCPSATIPTII